MKLLFILQLLTIILSPLYIVRFYIGFFPSTLLEVLIWLVIANWGFLLIKNRVKLSSIKTTFDIPILLLLTAASISVLASPDQIGGLGILRAYFLEPIIFYYSLVWTLKRTDAKRVILALLTAGWWLSALAILQKFTHQFSLAPIEILQDRVTGVYNSANSLALFLGPLSLLAGSLSLGVSKDYRRWIFFFSLPLFLMVTIWTRSRGGALGQATAFFILLYLILSLTHKRLKRWWSVVVGLVLVAAASFLIFAYKNPNPYSADTMQVRFSIWAGTLKLLEDHPFLGAGLNGFYQLYRADYRTDTHQELVQYPHNIILTFWTETGLLGLVAMILLIVIFYSRMWRKIFNSHYPLIGGGLIAAISYLLIHGIVDVPYFKNDLSLEFWVIFALSEWFLNH